MMAWTRKTASARRRARHWTACALAAALTVTSAGSPVVHAQSGLPSLGDAAGADLSPPAERVLGERIMREVRRDPAYLRDPMLEDYLNSLWVPLLEAARARGDLPGELADTLAMEAFLINSRGINAFALPGGYVGIYLGLMAVTGSRDELASVVAHELAHVTQRHIARSLGEQRQQSMVALLGMLLGALAVSRSPAAAEAMMAGSQAAAIAGQLGFSRGMEREADRIGFGLMVEAGFEPAGMAAMFDRLATASRLNDSGAFPYLRSHPLTVERMGEATARLGLPAAPSSDAVLPDRLLHATMQARARVLMDRSSDATRSWLINDEPVTGTRHDPDAGDQLWRHYGRALSAALSRDWDLAQASVQQALPLAQPEPAALQAVQLLAAEVDILRGDGAAALARLDRLDTAASLDAGGPGSARTLLLMRAQAASVVDATEEMRRSLIEPLRAWTITHPQDAPAWSALAHLLERQGARAGALRAHAEAQLAIGDASGAVDRLRAAQGVARQGGTVDYVESSIIDARLRAAQDRLREQQEAERAR